MNSEIEWVGVLGRIIVALITVLNLVARAG